MLVREYEIIHSLSLPYYTSPPHDICRLMGQTDFSQQWPQSPLFIFFKLSSLLSQVPETAKDLTQRHHFCFGLLCFAFFLLSRS